VGDDLLIAAWIVGKENEREAICSLMREKIGRLESFARTTSDRSRKMKSEDQADILKEMIVIIMRRYEK
jgi:hypothetical protein